MECKAFTGERYIFLVYDLVTKFSFVYAIRSHENEVPLITFRTLDQKIKRQFNTSPIFILLKRERGFGFEADDNSLATYCANEGIQLQLRAPDTPAQSGDVERSG
ncbi:hypothetical protein BU25DRAFT_463417 [Macroventuria anomochaeta]|uniref:Uncharacterized protein n=1 Tax=Macroventuria anomochaeta TaxID=301207 RepID=A0ACB6RLH9_9PLEO|nr:uncharacterized protein BU25DRAFT_463417 [Macroventuria anomochaeta]KAF2621817.1 hypothetical protein BU25DRAFT_463417 [Macroventuria anomochaeta]